MERAEIVVHLISILYCGCMIFVLLSLSDKSTEIMLIGTVFTLAFTCPLFWATISYVRVYYERKKIVITPEMKKKKKPDIAKAKVKATLRTQAEILEEQREKAKKQHGVGVGGGDKKKKVKPKKSPTRKAPPKKVDKTKKQK